VVPRFGRLVIETTGLADPTPILSTVLHDAVLRHHFHLGNVVATVDGVNGLGNLAEHEETAKQAAVADRLVITKTDIADPGEVAALRAALRRLNPSAAVLEARNGEIEARLVLGEEAWRAEARSAEVARWLAAEPGADEEHHHDRVDRSRHGDIRAFAVTLDRPIEWAAFGIWLTLLLHRHGSDILRVKGIVNVAGADLPVVVQGVQHLVHPPLHLAGWPFADRKSRLVFIARHLDESVVRASLEAFQALGASSVDAAPAYSGGSPV
jgi:G3E family GTPase